MDAIIKLFAILTVTFTVSGAKALSVNAPAEGSLPAATTAHKPLQRLWRDVTPLAKPGALCPQWWDVAIEAGWTVKQLPTLDYIMYRESRCRRIAHNTTLNRDGSQDYGLTQINDWSWCLPTKWQPKGWLQSIKVIQSCEDLFDPYLNLRAAKAIYDYSEDSSGNGFQPWGK
jgi:hypothetical protein